MKIQSESVSIKSNWAYPGIWSPCRQRNPDRIVRRSRNSYRVWPRVWDSLRRDDLQDYLLFVSVIAISDGKYKIQNKTKNEMRIRCFCFQSISLHVAFAWEKKMQWHTKSVPPFGHCHFPWLLLLHAAVSCMWHVACECCVLHKKLCWHKQICANKWICVWRLQWRPPNFCIRWNNYKIAFFSCSAVLGRLCRRVCVCVYVSDLPGIDLPSSRYSRTEGLRKFPAISFISFSSWLPLYSFSRSCCGSGSGARGRFARFDRTASWQSVERKVKTNNWNKIPSQHN